MEVCTKRKRNNIDSHPYLTYHLSTLIIFDYIYCISKHIFCSPLLFLGRKKAVSCNEATRTEKYNLGGKRVEGHSKGGRISVYLEVLIPSASLVEENVGVRCDNTLLSNLLKRLKGRKKWNFVGSR